MDRLPTPPPEINMKIPPKHIDFGNILPALSELRGKLWLYKFYTRKSRF